MSKALEALKELEIGVHDEWDGTSWIEDKLRPIKILEQSLVEKETHEKDIEFILRKIKGYPNKTFKELYDTNFDFSVVFDRVFNEFVKLKEELKGDDQHARKS